MFGKKNWIGERKQKGSKQLNQKLKRGKKLSDSSESALLKKIIDQLPVALFAKDAA